MWPGLCRDLRQLCLCAEGQKVRDRLGPCLALPMGPAVPGGNLDVRLQVEERRAGLIPVPFYPWP